MKLLSLVASSLLASFSRAEDEVSRYVLIYLSTHFWKDQLPYLSLIISRNRTLFLTTASQWCPAGNCQIYTNPFGLSGPSSNFNECYNLETGEMSEGVWMGSLTSAPDGWDQPEMCTAEQYSQCDTNAQCNLLISPGCSCYVSSSLHPYDACDGKDCDLSGCTGYECDGYVGVCEPGFNVTGNTCMIESSNDIGNTTAPLPTPSPSPSSGTSEASFSITIMLLFISTTTIHCIA